MATKFTCFVEFPKELKDRVWELALPDPSFMIVKLQLDDYNPHEPAAQFSTVNEEIEQAITGVARACKDSRAVAIRVFPAFLPTGRESIEIRFHPTKTLLCFSNLIFTEPATARDRMSHPYLSNIRHLAIVPDFPVDFESWCVIDIREFPKLERLVIMNETREICEGASRVAGRDEVENLVDQFREMYDGEMLTMPKIELWERDEEGNGSMKYKEDITPRF